jgi:hypothetical protein
MKAVLSILFGATFLVATAWALGTIVLRKLGVTLYRVEERLFGFVVGAACLSAIVFALSTIKLASKGVFLALGLAIIGYALYSGAHRPNGDEFPRLSAMWKWIFALVFSVFTVVYFFNAMAPEMSPDGMAYHLSVVAKYYKAHGFVRIPYNFYTELSQGIELLFFYAFAFGKHSAATLVHYAFLVVITFLMLCYGRRIGYPGVGAAAALFFYASPVVGYDAVIAYNDVAVAAVLFSVYYLLQIWDADKNAKLLAPIGILAGFGYAVKYTAFLAVPYALGFVMWKLWRAKRPVLKPVFAMAAVAAVFILPWMVKNWMWVDNPVAPFANRLFPNRYVHVSFEDDYGRFMRIYALTSYREIPLQLTVKGDKLVGLFGPLFLLTPLALLALRFRQGRQLLLAAVIFALPYLGNIGSRFLIPAAPFVSLALALAFANAGWLLMVLVLGHAVLSWPRVESLYCSPAAWRIFQVPVRAALRVQPEVEYLRERSQQYREGRLIEQLVPKGEKVLALGNSAESYIPHEVLVKYEAANNEVLGDILWTPMFQDYQPTQTLRLRFPARELRKLRLVENAQSSVMWSVHEFRIFDGGRELPRAPEWRLTAHPNPWDVQLAFDNSPVTRWRTWQPSEPGMFIEVDFGQSREVDGVLIESSEPPTIKLQGADAGGKWAEISTTSEAGTALNPVNLRGTASAELKARGIRYLLVGSDDIRAEDYQKYAALWGMSCIGDVSGGRLYRIE